MVTLQLRGSGIKKSRAERIFSKTCRPPTVDEGLAAGDSTVRRRSSTWRRWQRPRRWWPVSRGSRRL